MGTLEAKTGVILENETIFARQLAAVVVDRPQVSIWMILVPILFVYHIYRYQKYVAARKTFAEKYMITRRRALKAAAQGVAGHRPPEIDPLVQKARLPESVQKDYAAWLAVLANHYTDLLQAEGGSFAELAAAAYGSRTNYLLFLNRLNSAEKLFNAALKPHLAESAEDVDDIVAAMESWSVRMRRRQAEAIFP